MRVLIIANPVVGIDKKKRSVIDRIAAQIKKDGGTVDITYTYIPGLGEKHSSISPFEGYNTVYAAGGDGTVNDVASGLVGTNIPLGLIPLGTGNGLACGLGIPLDPDRFIDILMKNKTKKIDVGRISTHYFFSTTGIGYDARIAYDYRSKTSKRSIYGYFWVGIKDYFLSRSEKVTLYADGKQFDRRIFTLTVANTPQYGCGAIIAPEANPASGRMVAVIVPRLGMFNMFSAIKKLFAGNIHEMNQLEFIEFKNLRIKRSKPGLYQADGEAYTGNFNLNISIHPGALTVIVP